MEKNEKKTRKGFEPGAGFEYCSSRPRRNYRGGSIVEAADLSGKTALSEDDLAAALAAYKDSSLTNDMNAASVHDPSIIKKEDGGKGTYQYYIFGSHMAYAGSNDLMNWYNLNVVENDPDSSLFGTESTGAVEKVSYETAFTSSAYTGTITTLSGKPVDFGQFNADEYQNGGLYNNMWAPDVIYNKAMGQYCMYLSLNGASNTQESVIILLTSEDIEGPYVYQGPVLYTRVSDDPSAATYWGKTDMKYIYEDAEDMPKRYAHTDAGDWANYYPHAIDPAVFYDEAGKLWMVYGSWSGGIFMLELDEQTGLRDYTVSYVDSAVNNGVDNLTATKEEIGKDYTADPYYGKKVAGGYYVSGEGPYIEYIDGSYYLFLSYGEYAPTGNYQMRVFRSDNPDGPYVDSKGISAIYDEFTVNFNAGYGDVYGGTDMGAPGTTRGDRLMTNYQWDTMTTGETSQGHNSAITIDGKSYVIYHTKYNNGTEVHNVRLHELFVTEDGCLVAAPYEYDAKVADKASYSASEVTGTYDVIFDRYSTNIRYDGAVKAAVDTDALQCETPVQMKLTVDGKITEDGTVIGSWKLNPDGKNITMTINAGYADEHMAGTYHGVLVEQNANGKQATCFTVMNAATGIGIWGSFNSESDIYAIAVTKQNQKVTIPSETSESITLPTEGLSGAVVTWESSDTAVMTNMGSVRGVTEDTAVTLTRTISSGDYYYQTTYQVTVLAPKADRIDLTSYEYLKETDNPFYGQDLEELYIKYTINWSESAYKAGWDGLFSFYNSKSTPIGRVSVQSAPYVCFNDQSGNWMDINGPDVNGCVNKAGAATAGKDYTYEIAVVSGGSITMKENGVEFTPASNDGAGANTPADILAYISTACDKFSWGTGSTTGYWKTELCTLKDVVISDKIPKTEALNGPYTIGSGAAVQEMANPFQGENITSFTGEYTVTYPDSIPNLNGGLLAFYTSATAGRISIQALPYICYNEEANGMWIDIKGEANSPSPGNTYQYKFVITKNGVTYYVDGVEIGDLSLASGNNYNYGALLSYLSSCDKYSIGVNNDRSYWGSIASATLSDIRFAINEQNAVEVPVTDVETKYIVTYNTQGHGTDSEVVVAEGATLSKPADPTATGYQFNGWYTDAACTQAWNFGDAVTADMTLYAGWTQKAVDNTDSTGGSTGSTGGSTGGSSTPITNPSEDQNQTDEPEAEVKVGDKVTVGGAAYKVTATGEKKKEVAYSSAKKNAKTVKVPSEIKINGEAYIVTSIAKQAFAGNKKLTSVSIPSTVTKIGNGAFKNCTKLKKITIPASVTTIGKNAFKGCKTLKTVVIKSKKVTTIGKNAFKNIDKKSVIKVPASKKSAYKKLLKKSGYAGTVKNI